MFSEVCFYPVGQVRNKMEDDIDAGEAPSVWGRSHARLNRTVAALMRRGLDHETSNSLHAAGHTLSTLSQLSDNELGAAGVPDQFHDAFRSTGRPPIPFDTMARVLWANRWTCCVCRQQRLSVILHHIRQWSESRDHSDANLAVLCLEHHARAHTTGDLEQNLTPRRLTDAKAQWEEEVRRLDPAAILAASRIDGHHWSWFNHRRLLDLLRDAGGLVQELPRYRQLRDSGLIDQDGNIIPENANDLYLYQGSFGNHRYSYTRSVLEQVLSRTSIFNISDDLDRGFLKSVIRPGDLVLIQGRHVFKQLTKIERGPGQAATVRRQANGVRVSFTIDLWEAVATSAWGVWLRGTQNAASLVRVNEVRQEEDRLHLLASGVAVGLAMTNMATRSYVYATWPEDRDVDEDDWLYGSE